MADKPPAAEEAGKTKTKKLVRFDKDYTEQILWAGPLAPFPRMRDDLIDRLERPDCPGCVRAEQDELCARVQRRIARYNQIREQHQRTGHAEVEFSDEDEAAVEVETMERHARGFSNLTEEDMAFYAAAGSTADAMRRWAAATAGMPKVVGKDGKRRKVVRLGKEYIKMKVTTMPPPRPYPFMSKSKDPASRALDKEMAADAQKAIDRDAEMCRQYAAQGYADVEFTDDERDEDMGDWRPWAYLKAAGLVD